MHHHRRDNLIKLDQIKKETIKLKRKKRGRGREGEEGEEGLIEYNRHRRRQFKWYLPQATS